MDNNNIKNKKKSSLIWIGVVVLALVVGVIFFFVWNHQDKKKKNSNEVSGKDYEATECIDLGKYTGLKISLAATKDDLQTEIDGVLEEYTTYEQKKGTAKDGDMVYASFEGTIEGKRVDETCGSDYVTIGSGDWLPGFEDAFIGMKTGTTKKTKISVPKGTYGDSTIDGHTVEFTLSLKYICGESIVPEYNDEFVQSISKYKSTKEYNAYLKNKIEKDNRENKADHSWNTVLEKSKVTKYPKSLMQLAQKEVLQGYYDMADIYGQSHDQIFQSFGCKDEQEFKDTQLDDLAKDTVKEILVAEAIADKEDINYTKKEFDKLAKEEYESDKDSYKSRSEFDRKKKDYLKRTALSNAVKQWISKKTEYTN